MNPRERGFLLLTSRLGDPGRAALTPAQMRTLAQRVQWSGRPEEDRQLTLEDLIHLGYQRQMARRILELLEEEDRLEGYLRRGRQQNCCPITRVSPGYPRLLRRRLGLDSPGCLWAKGALSILHGPAIALVGSRELREENRAFAQAVGRHAAHQGMTLVSGNARGADRAAQDACLEAGGQVISIVADALSKQPLTDRVLYLSQEDYDEGFSPQRALSRNRCIHALGMMVLVAQADLEKGGTWDGTVKNLLHGWSPVACFRDGSESSLRLEQMGAYLVDLGDLEELSVPGEENLTFFDP